MSTPYYFFAIAASCLTVRAMFGLATLMDKDSTLGGGRDQTRADAATTTRNGMLTQTAADTPDPGQDRAPFLGDGRPASDTAGVSDSRSFVVARTERRDDG